ncbi:sensor histidine kinase [Pseudomonas songnenensis]|jgi:signal transduction histidine kinase|uniref:histidine kinase n=1 Tax=Pseudomonas songnenensis TaxID=1176259 RepID=A0A482U786_9PSED|nr:HAMP domain-containing sensor histidine kinase [Pseudomonas songnenensis]AWM59045.1 sensor histidine kinase [Stutzerimonas stutzeri]MCQ4301973.1 HAMP domain-containing histidine kinase [Pseudomonas songnenensis]RMH94032.1 sensor histidine kinase [Pseudomonas songnenensis]RYJ62385.1 HAMP domain-containing histidine kinase [Pseudomonas songnenensis]
MLAKQPLARRIVIAFTLTTLVVSGAFALGIVGVVHFIEEQLVTEELSRDLDIVLNEDLPAGRSPQLDASTHFFASHLPEHPMPEVFAALAEGFTELVRDDEAYYVYVRDIGDNRYVLVQEQHEFEARENALFNVVLAGFLLSVVGAWLLGRLMANRVMAPVSRLANQVRHRDQLHPLAPPLALQYPDDEVGHLAAAFDSTLGQLRQTLERERLFTADVSHELRTPLMVVLGACELLEQAELPPRAQRQAARIHRAAEEMQDLVETFLMLARARPQQASFAGNTSLKSVAAEQSERWAPLLAEKGLAFELQVEEEDSAVYNHTLLGAVMSNLLRNALHYTDRGTVRLILGSGGFRVEDSGVGIPLAEQERMFQPFVRGAEERGEGLGLGLSLVKRICAHQGWDVGVTPRQPQGSCFEVRLQPGAA